MSQPTVSVVVLGYNGRSYLEACLASVLDQDYPRDEYEVLYVDNASTDGSAEFVRERFADVRVVQLERNYGFAEGHNRGVEAARGRYIAPLNQDTVCHRRWLAEFVRVLDERADVLAAHANVLTPWCPGYAEKARDSWPPIVHIAELNRFGFVGYQRRRFSEEPIETMFVAGAAMMVRRDVWQQFGYLFDRDFFAYCEDTELALRIQNVGGRVLLVPTAVVYHDLRPSTSLSWSTLRKTLLILRNRFLAYYKNMGMREFLAFLPWLAGGAVLKPAELSLGRLRGVLYGAATLPLVPLALVMAALHGGRLASRRADILDQRTVAPFDLSRSLKTSGVK